MSHGARKVSHGDRKVSHGARKVSYGVRKVPGLCHMVPEKVHKLQRSHEISCHPALQEARLIEKLSFPPITEN